MNKRRFLHYCFIGLLAVFTGCGDDDLSFKDTKDGASFQTNWISTVSLDSIREMDELPTSDLLIYIKPSVLRMAPPLEGYYFYSNSDNALYKIRNTQLESLDPECNSQVKLKGKVHVANIVYTDYVMVDPYVELEVESITIK